MSGLNLNIANLGPGRPKKPLQAEYVRDLTAADVELSLTTERHSAPEPVQKLTDRHHSLARLIASGTSEADAGLITGYSSSRISILKNSPAFQELVNLYRAEVEREFATNLSHMSGLARDALLELRERIEEDPTKFSNRELLSITTDMHDRSAGTAGDGSASTPSRIELAAPTHDPEAMKAKMDSPEVRAKYGVSDDNDDA